jgi:hypothetical protein
MKLIQQYWLVRLDNPAIRVLRLGHDQSAKDREYFRSLYQIVYNTKLKIIAVDALGEEHEVLPEG